MRTAYLVRLERIGGVTPSTVYGKIIESTVFPSLERVGRVVLAALPDGAARRNFGALFGPYLEGRPFVGFTTWLVTYVVTIQTVSVEEETP